MAKGNKAIKKSNVKALFSPSLNEVVIFERPFLYGYSVESRSDYMGDVVSEAEKRKLKEKYRENRFRRARKRIIDLTRCNITAHSDYPQFLTLTYAENMKDVDRAFRDWELFIKGLNYALDMKLKYLAVIEFQERGAIHFHAILFDVPFRKDMLSLYKHYWKHGDPDIVTIKDPNDPKLAFYLSKYVSKYKKTDNRLDDRKSYFASRNIIRPTYEVRPWAVDNWILQNNLECETIEEYKGIKIKRYATKNNSRYSKGRGKKFHKQRRRKG